MWTEKPDDKNGLCNYYPTLWKTPDDKNIEIYCSQASCWRYDSNHKIYWYRCQEHRGLFWSDEKDQQIVKWEEVKEMYEQPATPGTLCMKCPNPATAAKYKYGNDWRCEEHRINPKSSCICGHMWSNHRPACVVGILNRATGIKTPCPCLDFADIAEPDLTQDCRGDGYMCDSCGNEAAFMTGEAGDRHWYCAEDCDAYENDDDPEVGPGQDDIFFREGQTVGDVIVGNAIDPTILWAHDQCSKCGAFPDDCTCNGKKYDNGKLRWDLLPLGPVEQIVQILTYGAEKYGPHNWQGVEDYENRYFAALMRHLVAWRGGEADDKESGLRHLAHALCNLVFLSYLEE